VAELPERYGLEVHAFALMDNHYHLEDISGSGGQSQVAETGVMAKGCGGGSRAERRAALQAYTEQAIRQGELESPWEGTL
jgi:hypothetical protein